MLIPNSWCTLPTFWLPWWLNGWRICVQCRRCRRRGLDPWVGKIPWRRKWQPTPVLLPGKSHGRRSLVGYSPWVGHDWSDLAAAAAALCQTTHFSELLPIVGIVLVAQSCPTQCDPMDCSPPAPQSMKFSRQKYWSGFPFPSLGDLPDAGIDPRSPPLQADSLPDEPQAL